MRQRKFHGTLHMIATTAILVSPMVKQPYEVHAHPAVHRGVHFNVKEFQGMGAMAVLIGNPTPSNVPNNNLYLLEGGTSTSRGRIRELVSSHNVAAASFSPEGRAIAVEESVGGSMRWVLMSLSGSKRAWLPKDTTVTAWLPNSASIVYSNGSTLNIRSLSGAGEVRGLRLPSGSQIAQLLPNSQGTRLAVVATVDPADMNRRYDVLYEYDVQSNRVNGPGKPLFHTTPGNGMWLARYAANGKDIYAWPDPAFGLSVMEDGQTLYDIHGSNGKWRGIVMTLPVSSSVQVAADGLTLIAKGEDRYPYEGVGQIGVESEHGWHAISSQPSLIQFDPSLSKNGAIVAYLQGKTLRGSAHVTPVSAMNWYRTVPQLVIHSFVSQKTTILTAAGRGISLPYITDDGQRVAYTDAKGRIDWIEARSNGRPHVLVTPGTSAVRIADWIR